MSAMQWRDRQGNVLPGEAGQDRLLEFLYGTAVGRGIVSILIRPWVSKIAGALMDSGISRIAIKPFIKSNRIDMSQFENRKYRSFNDFFTRQVRSDVRPVDQTPEHLICPCDCKLSVYPITQELQVQVKGAVYTMQSLLRDQELAQQFEGGVFLLCRLTKDDYHRYCYADNGTKGENVRIPGVYHTVNPAALQRFPVYKENTREYTVLESENFGPILTMEVGATMVGRIQNYHGSRTVRRGQEKGRFEFGGSTIILCLRKDSVQIDADLVENTKQGIETVVKMGEKIGMSLRMKQ